MKTYKSLSIIIALTAGVFAISGCASTKQARSVEASGFLGDYSQLAPGDEDEALQLYINPSAAWASYDKIIIDPIRVYASADSGLGSASREELQAIVDYFHAAVREQMGKQYQIVNDPGARTMRLRIALTDARGSKVALDTLSNILPPALVISTLKEVITGSATGVGRASVEAELVDTVSGQRLSAAVDARVGGKTFEGKFDKWDDVKSAIDYWAERLSQRLTEKRAEGKQ